MIIAAMLRPGCASRWLTSTTAILTFCMGGCAVGPDFHRPVAPAATHYTDEAATTQTQAQQFMANAEVPADWWTLFDCPALSSLVESALKANPTVAQAQAALRVAMENVSAQRGLYYPTAQGDFSVTRQRDAIGTLAPTLTSGDPIFSLYTPQVSVSYLLDVFGGNRRQIESLTALAQSQRFQLEATYLTLSSNVVVAAIQEASLRTQITATTRIINMETEQRDVMKQSLALGAIAESDVVAQDALLAQTQATLPPLLKQLVQQRDLIAALAGRLPSEAPQESFQLSQLTLPRELPISVPSRLVEQRPDVRSAEEQMHAASAQVGVAIANMLPQITLTASIGSTATDLSELFKAGSNFWGLGASFTQALFQGGALLHRKRAADATLDQAAAQYRASVIMAFQNVADALGALEHDADAVAAQARAEKFAADNLDIVRHQMDLGAVSYLSLLNAQQAYQQAVINHVQATANQYADTVALFQALGGGWRNRPDEAANSASSER